MRRTWLVAAVAALALAACGSDDVEPVADPPADEPADEPSDEPADEPSDEPADAFDVPARSGETTPDDPATGKPSVALPAEMPTELVVFDVVAGSGREAEVGDTVVVDYVGVLSEDGTEFDNSYDRGATFPVTLGVTSVIQGWQDGLLGAQAGSRIQLDIPADLAYGDTGSGDIIQPGDAITFVIDVIDVTPAGS